jgi:glycosyltransferase involved in cell wall biosynthesis
MAVIVREKVGNRLLPIAIMAHNEEKVIHRAVQNALSQNIPVGYSVKVVVVANGCSDRTEEIVKGLEKQNPNKVVLVSMREKGKTRAINRAIKFFDQISNNDLQIPYIIFLDADCEFNGKEALIDFVNRFEQNPQLCAVGADCLPDVFSNSRKDIVAEIYRTTYTLGQSVKINSISGMCYAIRSDILKKIDFPDFQFAEDMYLSCRLDGHFLKDRNIKIVFKIPSDLRGEIKRRTRQEISTLRYHEYYSYLKRKGVRVSLFEKPLDDDYRWWGATDDHIIKVWFRLKGIKPKFFVMAYALITLWAKIKAYRTLKKMRKNGDLDYWQVLR